MCDGVLSGSFAPLLAANNQYVGRHIATARVLDSASSESGAR